MENIKNVEITVTEILGCDMMYTAEDISIATGWPKQQCTPLEKPGLRWSYHISKFKEIALIDIVPIRGGSFIYINEEAKQERPDMMRQVFRMAKPFFPHMSEQELWEFITE